MPLIGTHVTGTNESDFITLLGEPSYAAGLDGRDFIFGGRSADLIFGGGAGDAIFGGAGDDSAHGGAGNDLIAANLGNDVLRGGGGADVLLGGGGADRFELLLVADSERGLVDRIGDFSREDLDKVDLRLIDANSQEDGHQGFNFVGSALLERAGDLRFAGNSLRGDVDGDGRPDFILRFGGGAGSITQGDLLL